MKNEEGCMETLWHGPGHQTRARCHRGSEPHDVHEAIYGSYDQLAQWQGNEAFTGYFDEPPQEVLA